LIEIITTVEHVIQRLKTTRIPARDITIKHLTTRKDFLCILDPRGVPREARVELSVPIEHPCYNLRGARIPEDRKADKYGGLNRVTD